MVQWAHTPSLNGVYAQSRGWEIVKEFKDEGWSGTRADRPAASPSILESELHQANQTKKA
jgi:hypothetical protein